MDSSLKPSMRRIGAAAVVATSCGPDPGPAVETEGTTVGPTEAVPTSDSDPTDSDPTDPTATTGEEPDHSVVIATSRAVDLLFVLDNSGSMAEEQALLSANLAAFIDVLESVGVDYRVAVTTTDSGNPRCSPATDPENGEFVLSSCLDRVDQGEFVFNGEDRSFACTDFCTRRDADLKVLPTVTDLDAEPKPRSWVERAAGHSNIEGVADNAEALRCYLPQGVAGCGFESHLESMFLALASATNRDSPTNFGFLRDAAQLAVVIVSDETDCSWSPDAKEIFTTNKVFWSDPNDPAPTSALCWNAGVRCTGGPGIFSECHAENFDLQAEPGADDADAVLQPVRKYIEFVKQIEAGKQQIDPDKHIQVALITGVPIGYEEFAAEIAYEDSPDPQFQKNFGIGPGCVLGDPGFPDATAVPPVREREFAEAFVGARASERNLYSVCQADYTAVFGQIAQGLIDQLKPACFPGCVADTDPATPTVEPDCTMREHNLVTDEQTEIAECEEVDGAWVIPAGALVCFASLIDPNGTFTPSKIDDMSPECVDEGFNLEFIVVRSLPPAAGTVLEATCELSDPKAVDCPAL